MATTASSKPSGGASPEGGQPTSAGRAPLSVAGDLVRRFLTLREGSIIVVTILVAIYFAINTESFLTGANFKTLLPYFAPIAILGAGEVFVMILGEIDLSIGATYLFAPFLFYKVVSGAGFPLVPGMIVALLACMAIGLANGFFVAVIGINSFVTTLGMLFTIEGFTLIISHAEPVATPGAGITNGGHLSTFAKVFGAGTYSELIWALAIIVLLQVVLTFTRWGIYTIAVGSNRLGSGEAGIKVRLVIIRNFILCALTGGLVGIFEAVRAASVQPDTAGANEILFYGIAAAVIGGTLLAGGEGTVVGALIGALFLGILKDGLILKGVNASYLLFYLGLAIIIAMTVNVYVQRVRKGSGLG